MRWSRIYAHLKIVACRTLHILYSVIMYIKAAKRREKERERQQERERERKSEKEKRNLIIVQTFGKIFVPFLGWTVTETPIMKCSRRRTAAYKFSKIYQTQTNTCEDAAIGIIISHRFSLSSWTRSFWLWTRRSFVRSFVRLSTHSLFLYVYFADIALPSHHIS